MNPRRRKQSEILVKELEKRSKKGLDFAKRTILAEKVDNKELVEALEHYIQNWNDFTHPGLFSIAYEAVGGDPNASVKPQAAIAMMAGAFDIHDDIIDKSETKHGIPTVFGKFGQELALLLGNAFLIEGFNLFTESIQKRPEKKRREMLEALKKCLFELGNAHALELGMKERMDISPSEYMKVIEMKAVGIEVDMRIGAVIGGGTSAEVEALARYGRVLGMLGTLREEFVDVFEIDELSQRSRNEYLPVPVLYAMQDDEAKRRIKTLFAKEKLTNTDLDELVTIVFETRNVKNVKKRMKDLVTEAICLISSTRNYESKALLRNLASTTLEDL
jgi:geranylgeranyl pyrophosphate synthase